MDKTGLDLVTKKNLPLTIFVNRENLVKIVNKVCKKISRTTDDPHILILLKNKIGNDGEVVDLICKWQNLQIDNQKEMIIEGVGKSTYSQDAIMNKGSNKIKSAFTNYDRIIDKIKKKASKSMEHREYMHRLEDLKILVEFINLFLEEKNEKAYLLMK